METLHIITDKKGYTMAVGDNYQNALADAMENMNLSCVEAVEIRIMTGELKHEISETEPGGYDGVADDCWAGELAEERIPYVDYLRG